MAPYTRELIFADPHPGQDATLYLRDQDIKRGWLRALVWMKSYAESRIEELEAEADDLKRRLNNG